MVERKLFKTKLCILFQKGHCMRQSCTFAHGEAELRRFSGAGSGRRDYRGADLRERLERRQSPRRRSPPGRNFRGRNVFPGQPFRRDFSSSRSPGRGRNSKRQRISGHSDVSDDLDFLDADGARMKKTNESNNDKDAVEGQLKQVQLDIEMLDAHKCELEESLDRTKEEADRLSSRNSDLEIQLKQMQEDCKRLTSKIKKFVKTYSRYARARDELKRTQGRLEKLGDQMILNSEKHTLNEDDSSLNIVGDGDDGVRLIPRAEHLNEVSPKRKRFRFGHAVGEESKSANIRMRDDHFVEMIKTDAHFQNHRVAVHTEHIGVEAPLGRISTNKVAYKHLINGDKPRPGRNDSPSMASLLDKGRNSDIGHSVPSTSMAAHAEDEIIEAVEIDDKLEAANATRSSVAVTGATLDTYTDKHMSISTKGSPLPQYKGVDEDVEVDVDGVPNDLSEIDLNNEVEIEN